MLICTCASALKQHSIIHDSVACICTGRRKSTFAKAEDSALTWLYDRSISLITGKQVVRNSGMVPVKFPPSKSSSLSCGKMQVCCGTGPSMCRSVTCRFVRIPLPGRVASSAGPQCFLHHHRITQLVQPFVAAHKTANQDGQTYQLKSYGCICHLSVQIDAPKMTQRVKVVVCYWIATIDSVTMLP